MPAPSPYGQCATRAPDVRSPGQRRVREATVDRTTTPRRWLRVAVALSAVLAAGTVLAPSAGATPADDARQRVQQAAQQLTTLDEQVHQAEGNVATLQRAAALAAKQATAAQAAVDAFAPQLRAIAQTGYTGQAQSRMAAFLTSGSADELVQQLTTLDVIAAHTNEVISGAARAQAAAQQATAAADAAAAKATAALTQLQQQQTQGKALVDQYQAELAGLGGADRAAVTTALAGQPLGVPTPAQIAAMAPSPAIA